MKFFLHVLGYLLKKLDFFSRFNKIEELENAKQQIELIQC